MSAGCPRCLGLDSVRARPPRMPQGPAWPSGWETLVAHSQVGTHRSGAKLLVPQESSSQSGSHPPPPGCPTCRTSPCPGPRTGITKLSPGPMFRVSPTLLPGAGSWCTAEPPPSGRAGSPRTARGGRRLQAACALAQRAAGHVEGGIAGLSASGHRTVEDRQEAQHWSWPFGKEKASHLTDCPQEGGTCHGGVSGKAQKLQPERRCVLCPPAAHG